MDNTGIVLKTNLCLYVKKYNKYFVSLANFVSWFLWYSQSYIYIYIYISKYTFYFPQVQISYWIAQVNNSELLTLAQQLPWHQGSQGHQSSKVNSLVLLLLWHLRYVLMYSEKKEEIQIDMWMQLGHNWHFGQN